jgi:serine/threonine protein kinase
MHVTVGDRLGPYEVLALLGKGGMGVVYRALDTRVHREVAIKVSSERFSERFEREARAIAALNHPNVCTLYDLGPDYLVMELVDGPTLADRLIPGPIPLDESLKFASQIADALSSAHRKGIVHRDLKPGNIKIKPDGTVKVLDFGLAKVLGPGETGHDNTPDLSQSPTITSPAMTMAGVVLGTAAYMSPEQAKGKAVDKTADVWAFGVTLYEMLTGQPLHHGETVSETLASVLRDTPDLTRVPARVRRLLRSCLQKNPDDRLHEIADWKLLLDDAAEPSVLLSAPRTRWLWPAIAAMLLVAVAAMGVVLYRANESAPPEVRSQIPQPEGLTFNPGTQAAISPDGRWIGFPALGPDNVARMYIRSVDSLAVSPLPGSEGIPLLSPPPFWSDDSRFVVYAAQGKLKKSEITGTPAQTIADIGVPFVQGGSWSRDGVIIYARNRSTLQQVSSSGGTPTALTAFAPGDVAHRTPQFLPDGRRFLYLRVTNSSEKTGVYVGSLDATPEAQPAQPLLLTDRQAWWTSSERTGQSYLLLQRDQSLLAQPFDPVSAMLSGTPVPVADGVGSFATATAGLWSVARHGALVYRSGGTGLPRATWLDSMGREVGAIPIEPGSYSDVALSPDGKRLTYRSNSPQGASDIWVADVAGEAKIRLTFDPRLKRAPVWSPDGTTIVYSANRGARDDLYEKNADGSGDERLLLQTDQNKTAHSWSRDGRFILFSSADPNTREDIWVLPLQGDRTPFLFLKTDTREGSAQFSPDGRWIAYLADVSGTPEVFVRPFVPDSRAPASSGGAQWMISSDGGAMPRWSADGKRLFFLSIASTALMAVDVRAGASFQTGATQRVLTGVQLGPWSPDPGGNRFLMMRPSAATGPPPPFTLVLNWMTKLER